MIELIENDLLPYVRNKKVELDLCSIKKWLLISDMFKGRWVDKVKSLIEKHGTSTKWYQFLITMTNYFQQLDLTVNWSRKLLLRDKTQMWYAEQVQAQISKGIAPEVYLLIWKQAYSSLYTQIRKLGDSVLQSYSHRQGYCEKWMVQIWDNQSKKKKKLLGRSIRKLDYIRYIFAWAQFQEDKL